MLPPYTRYETRKESFLPFDRIVEPQLDTRDDVVALVRAARGRDVTVLVNNKLEGKAIRIPGYIVPLEEGKNGMTEFLLVPYFGACIHSPPPPANQIIHVLPQSPAKGFRSMDAVWISGTLVREKTDSYMGASSYRMQAKAVEAYENNSTRTK